MIKEAIILAGGLGTRLKGVINDIPKPMAPIGEKPFLTYLLDYLVGYGIQKVILAVGYKYEAIQNYYKSSFKGMKLEYAVEDEPMGTGGGIANALKFVSQPNVLLLNGDTFFQVNLEELCKHHESSNAAMTLSLKEMHDFDRYGTVLLDGSRVISFQEKTRVHKGLINGGVYIFNTAIFNHPKLTGKFSFEKDVLEASVNKINMQGYCSDSYFIDIGVPEDYQKAQQELPELKL